MATIFYATIQEWKHLLKENKYKNIIVDALKFLAPQYCGVNNHLHIIWQSKGNNTIQKFKTALSNIPLNNLKNF